MFDWDTIGALLWALLVTCLVLVLAYWFTRKVAGRLSTGRALRGQGRFTVLDQVSLGRDQRVVLVRVGDAVYLLGVTPGGISRLGILPKDEAEPWLEQDAVKPRGDGSVSFVEALRRTIEQRKR